MTLEHTPYHIKYPKAYLNTAKCKWCSVFYGSARRTSRFCSNACKQANYRAEKRKRETGSYNG